MSMTADRTHIRWRQTLGLTDALCGSTGLYLILNWVGPLIKCNFPRSTVRGNLKKACWDKGELPLVWSTSCIWYHSGGWMKSHWVRNIVGKKPPVYSVHLNFCLQTSGFFAMWHVVTLFLTECRHTLPCVQRRVNISTKAPWEQK